MPRYTKREFQLGDYWLSKQARSPAWCRTWFDRASGQTKRVSLRTTDIEEAKERLTDWFVTQKTAPENPTADAPLAEVFARYYEHHGQHLSSNNLVQLALRYWLEFYGTDSVEEASVISKQEQFHAWLISKKSLKPNSAARIVSNGKTAISWAWKRGEIPQMPYFIPVKDDVVAPPRGRPLEVTDIAAMIKHARATHLVDFIILMIATAARPDAILDLTFDRCDFENRLFILNPTDRKQTKKYRPTVKMPKAIVRYLEFLKEIGGSEYVVHYGGKKISKIKKTWCATRDRAGLDDQVNPYSLRHTLARHLRRESVSAWEAAAQLGHKQRALTTTEIYAPFDPSYLSEASRAIDAFFGLLTCELRVNSLEELLGD